MSVTAMLCTLMGGLEDGSVVMRRSGSGICVMSVLFATFFRVKNCPQRYVGFSGAGSIRKMPEDVSLISVGITSGSLAEEDDVIAVA